MSTNMQRFITKVQLAVAVFVCISSLLLLPTQSFEIRTAILPADLPSIQDCRRSAYAGKSVNLPAAKSFCNADQIQREGYICIIAKDSSNSNDDGVVLGTADLNTKVCIPLLYICCIFFSCLLLSFLCFCDIDEHAVDLSLHYSIPFHIHVL